MEINKESIYEIVGKAQKYDELLKFTKERDELHCTFCGHSQGTVKKLIAGPKVYICDECIELCNEILKEDGLKEGEDRNES